MKANRKSLIFAFCAMASVVGLAGCSDDSSSSTKEKDFLTVTPKTVELGVGESKQVEVKYNDDAKVTIESRDPSCVEVSISSQSSGSTQFDIKAVSTTECSTTVAVSTDNGNLETVSATVDSAREVFKTDKKTLSLKTGETADVVVTHTQNGEVVSDKIKASIGDTSCAVIESVDPTDNVPNADANSRLR